MANVFEKFQFPDALLRLSQTAERGWEIYEVDYEKAMVKAKKGQIITRWRPWVALAGKTRAWLPPKKGERVMLLSPSGDYNQGVIVSGFYVNKFPAPSSDPDEVVIQFDDDTRISYNTKTSAMEIDLSAAKADPVIRVRAAEGKGKLILDVKEVVINGDLTVDGAISATGDVTDKTRSMAEDRTQFFNAHTHVDSQGGPTGPPDPQE